jgi:chromosome segregation ATPase
MSNQWGRNNQVTRSGGGSSGLLLAALLCLAVAGAGGYFWFARQQMQAEITALKAATSSLTEEVTKANAEKDRANKALVELKKNSGNWAEELEKDYANLTLNEVPKLNRLLDKRDSDIAALEKLLSTEKIAAKSAAGDFTATIARLNEQLTAAKSDAGDAWKQAEDLGNAKLALDKQVASLKSDLERATADTVAARKALEQKVAEVEKQPPTFKSALDLARDVQIKTLEQNLSEERSRVAVLEKQLADQAAEVAKKAVVPAMDTPVINDVTPETDVKPEVEATAPTVDLVPRDRLMVENILSSTRGIGFLDEEKTTVLKDKLTSGACVTDALESVFDKVPLILMRNLMRDFKSDC